MVEVQLYDNEHLVRLALDLQRRIERLEEEMDVARDLIAQQIKTSIERISLEHEIQELKERLGLSPSTNKTVPPHPRLRQIRAGAVDYASMWHTEAEHLSHGKEAYRKTHGKSK